ncbi:hydroxysqualene dehydroxylase HpnE [Pseudonocardia acaciae]|uniref:hydroxysqualene dehydroxylase HpnE n=1 Tax=Pseudonocardia acaciae TaxID=551276 RepID=UPI000685B446|nr:hydroxysqualene dehydroxylase HpnE [Pseudonocardia acaciae]
MSGKGRYDGPSHSRVAVVGGGLAGITAALRCADAGASVVVYEARRKLGGLTHSFRRGELAVDNGQHVFLRCCTAYRELLERLGVAADATLQDRMRIAVRTPGDPRTAVLRRGMGPAPLHLAGSVLGYHPLSVAERLRFGGAGLALRGLDPGSAVTDARDFGGWLREHGQTDRAIDALWDLVGIATLNARADDASLALAAMVFQRGLLTEASAADIGWSRVPLGRLHGEAATAALGEAGVEVRMATPVRRLAPDGSGWRVGTDGPAGDAFDAVVLAAPPPVTEKLLPPGAVDLPAGWSERLGATPIVNVHVVLDRRVTDEPFLAGVGGTEVQWVFDRTEPSGLPGTGQYLALSLSAADELIDLPTERLRERFLPALAELLPAVNHAEVRDFFVTRERTATFRQAPGSAAHRPPAPTGADGVYLAGAWTATGWPATMEGAVRSGVTAASLVMDKSRVRQGVVA